MIASADVYYLNVTDNNRKALCSQFKSLSVTAAGTNLQVESVKTVPYGGCTSLLSRALCLHVCRVGLTRKPTFE